MSGFYASGVARAQATPQAAKLQRVAPYGAAVATPNAVRTVNRYKCHGGGPALGAPYAPVNALSATSGRPAAGAVALSQRFQRGWIDDPARFALADQVDARQPRGDGAGRARVEVARLAGSGTAGEVEVAVVPDGTDDRGRDSSD